MAFSFFVGDRVRKISGYAFPGLVVAVFQTIAGKERYVVEFKPKGEPASGMLHIFSPEQLEWDPEEGQR